MIKRIMENMKDPITDIVGLAIILLTIYERYSGDVDWVWEGIAGITVGTALFIMPDQWLKDSLDSARKKFTDKDKE